TRGPVSPGPAGGAGAESDRAGGGPAAAAVWPTGRRRPLLGRGRPLRGHDGRAGDRADRDRLVDGTARVEMGRLTIARLVGGPGARDAAAEQRRADHDPLERVLAGDVAAGHAAQLARGEEARDGRAVRAQDAALQVGLHAAEVLAGEGQELDGVERRLVERSVALQLAAGQRVGLGARGNQRVPVAQRLGEGLHVEAGVARQLLGRVALVDVGRLAQQLVHLVEELGVAAAVVGVGDLQALEHAAVDDGPAGRRLLAEDGGRRGAGAGEALVVEALALARDPDAVLEAADDDAAAAGGVLVVGRGVGVAPHIVHVGEDATVALDDAVALTLRADAAADQHALDVAKLRAVR